MRTLLGLEFSQSFALLFEKQFKFKQSMEIMTLFVRRLRKILQLLWIPLPVLSEGFKFIVKDEQSHDALRRQTHRKQYIVPLCVSLYFFADMFYYLYAYGYHLENDRMMLCHHIQLLILPNIFRVQNEIIMIGLGVCLIALYSLLIFHKTPHKMTVFPDYHQQNILCFPDGKSEFLFDSFDSLTNHSSLQRWTNSSVISSQSFKTKLHEIWNPSPC